MPDCRNCGAPVRAAKVDPTGEVVPLENQPEAFTGGKADGFYRIVRGASNPMLVEPKLDDVPGQYFKRHECDARV